MSTNNLEFQCCCVCSPQPGSNSSSDVELRTSAILATLGTILSEVLTHYNLSCSLLIFVLFYNITLKHSLHKVSFIQASRGKLCECVKVSS